jgi:hypothetical protein
MTGLALAIPLEGRIGLAIACTVTMWAVGVSFVTTRWALESMPFAQVDQDMTVRWTATAQQGREHSLGLVRWLPSWIDPRDLSGPVDVRGWRAVHGNGRWTAPWNLASALAGGAGALAGAWLAWPELGSGLAGGIVTAGLVASVLIIFAGRRRALALGTSTAVALLAAIALGSPEWAAPIGVWAIVMAAHSFFTSRSLLGLGHPVASFVAMTKRN